MQVVARWPNGSLQVHGIKLIIIIKLLIFFFISHWGRVTHICIGNLTIIASDNGLSAPSLYLNQCRDIVNWTLRNKFQRNCNSNIFINEKSFESVVCEMVAILPRTQRVNSLWFSGVIWCHGSGSLLGQVMAWCHSLIQCWLIISTILVDTSQINFQCWWFYH